MTKFRILGAAALALVILASDALAQETSSDVRAQVREALRDDSDVRAQVREAVREALQDEGIEGREEVRDARREGREERREERKEHEVAKPVSK